MHKAKESGQTQLARHVAAVGVLVAALVAFPALTRADDAREEREHGRGRHSTMRWDERPQNYAYRQVPRRISVKDRQLYGRYYAGQAYYRPHRHHHHQYRFPVFVDEVVVYRPYYYCRDDIFLYAPIRLPRLAIDVWFGPPGFFFYEPVYGPLYPHYRHHHDDDDEDDYEEEYDD